MTLSADCTPKVSQILRLPKTLFFASARGPQSLWFTSLDRIFFLGWGVQSRTGSKFDVKLQRVCGERARARVRSRACRGHWPLTGAKSCLSVKTSRVNTDSQWSVNCALPLVTVKLALSLGQLPGYIHTARHLSSPKPAQRSSAAPEPGWCWERTKCARGEKCQACFFWTL